MQLIKYGILLVLGIAAPACGGDEDGGGGAGEETGGSGGSSTGGSSTGGSSTGGSSTGGSSTGGSSTGGSSTGGSGGGCTGDQVNLFEHPDCVDFFECVFDEVCAQFPEDQRPTCIDTLQGAFETSFPACITEENASEACEMVKASPEVGMMYPQCQ